MENYTNKSPADETSGHAVGNALQDRYALAAGSAFMSGVHALVRLPMLQRERDRQQGRNTAGLISGYRGSPLGGYDQALAQAAPYLRDQHIVFQPGVNEELAATALWGTQQLGFAPPGSNRYDGVFGIWYGKGPGVDRCADVFKHANMAGTTPWGGVIAVAGDDHVARSSTAAHQSDHIFKACGLPVFFPASVQEILDLGLHAFALSRFAGVWSGMKTIQEIVESSATVQIDPQRVQIRLPEDFVLPPGGLHIRWPDTALAQEARLYDYKWYAALAYIRANRLNYNVIEGPNDRLGLMASGKAFSDTRQALRDLGLDDSRCQRLGIRLHKVGVVWPLEAQLTREFATGLQEILVVEEKRQVIEYQLKEELYNWRADVRPTVLGKFNTVATPDHYGGGGEWSMPNPSAQTLLRANADLTPAMIARAIAGRLRQLGVDADTAALLDQRLALLQAQESALHTIHLQMGPTPERAPWFCSGCPHNTSTRVPQGSRAMAGIGCHFMTIWMDRATIGFTQMGGEGVPWVGQQPFSHERHVFANLGDGTYFHSGLLAIRQSIAAGVNITYKLLYNDAVAMTGGQQVGERAGAPGSPWISGHSVLQIAHSLRAEGVAKIIVVTDEPQKYQSASTQAGPVALTLPAGIAVEHRDALERVQLEFRAIAGTTVIIYDQTCATEKRRRRKRGTLVTPSRHVVINELVCEGCGDCSVQSNCLSVEPVETEFGRKRRINQSGCNQDFSCLNGFCPSFVTVEGGQLRRPALPAAAAQAPAAAPPLPDLAQAPGGVYGIVVAGVGGTGVITLGQLLGMAAHLQGLGIVTQDAGGLAQKGGATWSHVLIGASQDAILTTRVSTAGADLVIGGDPMVTASAETLQRMCRGRTRVALNTHSAPSASFVTEPDWVNPGAACVQTVDAVVGAQALRLLDAQALAEEAFGDSMYTNLVLLGHAWQSGWVPLQRASLLQAMELNGVAVARNQAAFELGCRAALGAQPHWQPITLVRPPAQDAAALQALVQQRAAFLRDYQNAAWAERYQRFVAQVSGAEMALQAGAALPLAHAVARNLFRLMAYKDEYEVARLHTDAAFLDSLRSRFEGDYRLQYHLAVPGLARRNARGELQKATFGPWVGVVFRLLARLRVLRGTALDVFGYFPERRTERALIAAYEGAIAGCLPALCTANRDLLTRFARLPHQMRGFGHIKARQLAAAMAEWEQLLGQYRQ